MPPTLRRQDKIDNRQTLPLSNDFIHFALHDKPRYRGEKVKFCGACDGHSFINMSQCVLPGDNAIPYSMARFYPQHFELDLFRHFGMDIPPSIGASVQKRQAEFLAGRICAQAMLQLHGRSPTQVNIGTHRAPHWPEGIVGSITHNSHFSAATVTTDRAVKGIGIDIETVIEPPLARTIKHQIANEREMDSLGAPGSELNTHQRLTLLLFCKGKLFQSRVPYW